MYKAIILINKGTALQKWDPAQRFRAVWNLAGFLHLWSLIINAYSGCCFSSNFCLWSYLCQSPATNPDKDGDGQKIHFIWEKYFMFFFCLSESVVKGILQEILTSIFSCDPFIFFLIWCFLPVWTPLRQEMVNGWPAATQEKNRGFPEERNSLLHGLPHDTCPEKGEQKSWESRLLLHEFLIQVLKTEHLTTGSPWPRCPAFLSRYPSMVRIGHAWAMPWCVVETCTLIQDPKSTSR